MQATHLPEESPTGSCLDTKRREYIWEDTGKGIEEGEETKITGKKRKIVKTLYLENNIDPFRVEITKSTWDRVKDLQRKLNEFPFRRNEHPCIDLDLRRSVIKIYRKKIDIGVYGFEDWESLIDDEGLDELPKVFFSSMFLYYLTKEEVFPQEVDRKAFWKVILPKHKELMVWKKIGGEE